MTRQPTLILLDRDGVINEDSDLYIKSPDEWCPIPSSLEALKIFSEHNISVGVATNQSGLARGLFSLSTLEAIHRKMITSVSTTGGNIDKIVYCPHGPNEGCGCRKPLPGMLNQLLAHFKREPGLSIAFVGDSLKDLQAAEAIGLQPILVLTGKGKNTQAQLTNTSLANVPIFESLLEYALQLEFVST